MNDLLLHTYEVTGLELVDHVDGLSVYRLQRPKTVRVVAFSPMDAIKAAKPHANWVSYTLNATPVPTDQILREIGAPTLPGI